MKLLLTNKIQNVLFAGCTTALLAACGTGGAQYKNNHTTATGETLELGVNNPICQQGMATQEGRIIDSKNKAVPDVTVEIAGCTVTTDKNGVYKFSNIPSSSRTSVNFSKKGYMEHSEIIKINNITSNFIETSLDENLYSWSYDSQDGSSGTNLEIASNIDYLTQDGSNYTGKINIYYSQKDTTTPEGRDIFPGDYKGKDSNGIIVSLVSYSLMVIELKDKNNNALTISEPITINVRNINATKDEVIPLWYYNQDKGIWIEDGSAYRDENGIYICEIPHTGTWSLNKPIETEMGLYKGKIVDEDQNPITNVRLHAKGKNWISQDLSTDENGEFKIYVVPNETFTLSAYDYKEEFAADFPDTLAGISAGDIVEE